MLKTSAIQKSNLIKIEAKKWIKTQGSIYKNPSSPIFLNDQNIHPFPTNPFFKPPKPLSDSTRQSIYDLYKQDPIKWTPRALSQHFQISIIRANAILRLKALQESFILKNKPIQSNLAIAMDKLLASKTLYPKSDKNFIQKYEPQRSSYASRITPFFKFTNESESFTPIDAATLLSKQPWKNIESCLNINAQRVFKNENTVPELIIPQTISNDPKTQSSKVKFMIVDTHSKQQYIRDTNGILRLASTVETLDKKHSHLEKFILE